MGWMKVGAVLLAALVLASCQTTPTTRLYKSAERTTTLAPSDNKGVLIIGLQIESLIEKQKFSSLDFWTIDKSRRLLVHPDQGGHVVILSRGSWLFGRDKQGDVEYVLQTLPAGDYYLTYVELPQKQWPFVPKPTSFAFTIKPGVATYIGTYDFDPPYTIFGDYEIETRERRPNDARALLAQYPHMPQEMWDQTPEWFNLKCKLKMQPQAECLAR